MIPILFPADATTFATNGLGRLPECIRCEVTEERNGIYEMEMELPITARHYAEIVEGMIISVIHDDTKIRQPFIIYRRTAPINGTVTFYAHHVSYLLSGIVLRPYTANTCAEALALMPTYSMSPNPFSFWTDKQTTASFKVEVPTGIRQQLAGIRGSVLDTFGGGEYEFDNFTVKLYQNRGTDSGVQIRYGKNLLDVEKEVDVSGIAGGVVGWWKGGDPGSETVIHTAVIYADGYGPGSPVLSLDLSGDFSEAPTVADLTARVNQYILNTKPQEPIVNVKVDFVALWQTSEYKDIAPLERVRLCDTVHVIYDALGVDVESKVIRTKYNVLTERYEEIELGQPKTNFTELITAKTEDLINAVPTRSMIQAAVNHATEMITGGLGGHVVMNLNADGEPQEILIMDTDDVSTAVNVIRINQAGIGFSTTGYNGPFRSAWTIDGHFVADFIDTGNLNAALITAGTMLADRILGGTLKLGGANYGVMQVYDSMERLIAEINAYNGVKLQDYSGTYICYLHQGASGVLYHRDRTITRQVSVGTGMVNTYDVNGDSSTYCIGGGTAGDGGPFETLETKYNTNDANSSISSILLNMRPNRVVRSEYRYGSGEYVEHCTFEGARYTHSVYYSDADEAAVFSFGFNNDGYIEASISSGFINNQHQSTYYEPMWLSPGSCSMYGRLVQFQSSSSKRYKHDINRMTAPELSPKKLLDLPVRQFIYNDDSRLQYHDMKGQLLPGFIAEEVAEIYPAALIRDQSGRPESWDERRIIPGMLALIQDQEKRIVEQEEHIQRLEAAVKKLVESVG